MRLKSKVALLTHGGNPLGQAVALALASEGADLFLCGFPDASSPMKDMAREAEGLGRRCLTQEGDLMEPPMVQSIIEATRKQFGRIDILVNQAAEGEKWPRFIEDFPAGRWDEAIDASLKPLFLFCQGVIPLMKDQRSGKIINLSSRGARTADELSSFVETAGNAGIFGLTRQLAHQLGPWGIRVNAVASGIYLPGWRWEKEWMLLEEKERAACLAQIPLRRFARPEEIAKVVCFLASEDSSYITGATLDVDGGQSMPIFPLRSEGLKAAS